MKKSRGSAIVIAVLLITAIGAIAFSFGRVLYLELANASLYENGVGAYYAAESGVEEGFLRYRFDTNRNPEVPFTSWSTTTSNMVFRNQLTNCNSGCVQTGGTNLTNEIGISKTGTLVTDDANQFYDLRVGSKGGVFAGDDVNGGGVDLTDLTDSLYGPVGSSYRVARDDSKKIDMGNIYAPGMDLDVHLYFKPVAGTATGVAPFTSEACMLIEAEIIGQKGTNIEQKKVLLENPTCSYSGTNISVNGEGFVPYIDSANGYYSVTDLKSVIAPTVTYSNASLYLKPIGADMKFMLQEVTPGSTGDLAANPLFAANATITSTGYYGGVAKTLSANIDRQSGTLYDLFDYVIYQVN